MEGSFAAPLFFLALALACAASRTGTVLPWASSAVALLLAGMAGRGSPIDFSPFSWPILGYALLVVLDTLLVSPAYTAAGLYHPLFLVLGYLAARGFSPQAERGAAFVALALGAGLAAWGLMQIGLQGMARAQAAFETPATYAAVVNLLLLPVVALVLCGRRGALLFAIVFLLSAAIFASGSRGGLLALAIGIGASAVFCQRARLLNPRSIAIALALLAAGWLVTVAVRAVSWPATTAAAVDPKALASASAESSQSRLELYALAWETWLEQPATGTGYLTFRYALERGRAQVPSYGGSNETWFVHNDYLQSLQELGPLGLAALLALVLLPAWLAYRRIPDLPLPERATAAALAAALAGMACHALVDFPFYIPACLVLYGALYGGLERRLGPQHERSASPRPAGTAYVAARAVVLVLAGLTLLRPVAAEAVASRGMQRFADGDGPAAALWLATAQRIEPGDWRYHWYAGQFWDSQAVTSGRPEAAQFAAAAYAAGVRANPLEIANLLGMISVHRRHRKLLDAPASPAAMQGWMAQAEALAPMNGAVRRERALLGVAR